MRCIHRNKIKRILSLVTHEMCWIELFRLPDPFTKKTNGKFRLAGNVMRFYLLSFTLFLVICNDLTNRLLPFSTITNAVSFFNLGVDSILKDTGAICYSGHSIGIRLGRSSVIPGKKSIGNMEKEPFPQ